MRILSLSELIQTITSSPHGHNETHASPAVRTSLPYPSSGVTELLWFKAWEQTQEFVPSGDKRNLISSMHSSPPHLVSKLIITQLEVMAFSAKKFQVCKRH